VNVRADVVIKAKNKQTHEVMETSSIGLSQLLQTIFHKNVQISLRIDVLRIPLRKDCYYKIEVNEIRAFNVRRQLRQYNVDDVKLYRMLPTAVLHVSNHHEFLIVRDLQSCTFPFVVVLSLYFLFEVLIRRTASLVDPFAWVGILLTATSLAYSYPGSLPVSQTWLQLALFFAFNLAADAFIIARPIANCRISHFALLAAVFFDLTLVRFYQLSLGDSIERKYLGLHLKEKYTMTEAGKLLNLKSKLYWLFLVVNFAFGLIRPSRHRKLVPVLFILGYWICKYSRAEMIFMENERNPEKAFYNQAFVPAFLLMIQYAVTLSDKWYFFLPPIRDASDQNAATSAK
jgi:hypothetical protein